MLQHDFIFPKRSLKQKDQRHQIGNLLVFCNPLQFLNHQVFFLFLFLQIGGASWWRVCYQRGLPRLVKLASTMVKIFVELGTLVLHSESSGLEKDGMTGALNA